MVTAEVRFNLELVLWALLLVGLIFLGFFIIWWFKRWQAAEQAPLPPMGIEDYRILMEQGLLEPREFERIRERMELKEKSASPPHPPSDLNPPVK